MSKCDYLKLKQDLTARLTRYELSSVVATFRELDLKNIPAPHIADFARIARQAHLYKEALAILQESVHGAKAPSTDLLLEYASCLRRLGMVNQCLHLLTRGTDHPSKSLHEAYCYIHLWDYKKAQAALEDFLKQENGSERERIVAQLNLISCFIFLEDFDKATSLINEIQDLCQKNYHQFYLNLLEMTGQIHIGRKEIPQALAILEKAAGLAAHEPGNTTLFIEKWKLVAEAHQGENFSLQKVGLFKGKIRGQAHWESLRDLDYQIGLALQDPSLINTAYFGTPFASFKNRVKTQAGKYLANTHLWHPPGQDSAVIHTLDPLDTRMPLATFGLIQHRLLLVMLSDFYRPQSVARLFDCLFPQDIFDPQSSPKRIYALVHKLQEALGKSDLPFEILSTIHGYRLRHKTGGAILIYDKMVFTSTEELLHYSLRAKYHLNQFTPRELAEVLNVSSHKAYRWIQELKEQNLISQDVSGSSQQGRFILKAA